jgi:uncharacterized cupin superfamily protein
MRGGHASAPLGSNPADPWVKGRNPQHAANVLQTGAWPQCTQGKFEINYW